ncbi:spindle checkpoint protein [Saccharomycopsis crataegensis]|uniref:Spindle checkpoint protein n=1 Tax=Saccharomycopsis crataegensis TaxID=43959 RepID=A0AAV5QLK6_9ASCO|nr:spindle checkpoint protein [Saccharomycopsis crataegensis]
MSTTKFALKGSSKCVCDFFEYSLHSLLYQRGLYAPEDFTTVKKYGLPMMFSIDEEVKNYIRQVMSQVHKWVYRGSVTRLVVPIVDQSTDDVVERWEFVLEVSEPSSQVRDNNGKPKEEIQKEIQAIIRQITASVTFLPALDDGSYTFSVLVYGDSKGLGVPTQWVDTKGDGKEVELSQGEKKEVIQFRSFSTDNHKVGAFVSYKIME